MTRSGIPRGLNQLFKRFKTLLLGRRYKCALINYIVHIIYRVYTRYLIQYEFIHFISNI